MAFGPYFIQIVGKSSYLMMKLKKVESLFRTRYQNVAIVDLEEFGRSLVLDDLVQSTHIDEPIYHESLVHPAMITHPNPEKALIIGGGEGATLREVLKHSCVKRAVMVDIDGELVEEAKKLLANMHAGSFFDPRAEVIIMDGKDYVEQANEVFNVAIMDLTDPYGPEIARQLYSAEFYSKVYKLLSDDGVIVTQAGTAFFFEEAYDQALNSLRKVFPIVREYMVWIPSFGYACCFLIGSKKNDPAELKPEEVDEKLSGRGVRTRFYSGRVHQALMLMPVLRKSMCEKEL
ncbi:MAG: polyamine aminopropyltransferase [Candidatus Methanomethylicota archaeon]|uniref:Polyamine aminopropyltransferase n=1 Tax=Thermoproteota archaeon TaxID=2056631 RepID=A0A497EWB5_9CREN|nr:MAG: polyamine aminopropyltransferase [Candidatus Verstraetearchaeota archaeon]RLE51497.1 MAG: polyamine aminopropyltransferase [Candidatus Verstraetearchaeota archaeon]